MATKIQIRGGTAAQWTSANPTLSEREMGVETDTRKFKIGDGSTAWTSLGYGIGVATFATISGDVADNAALVAAFALKEDKANTAVVITDAATMDIASAVNTLSSSSSTRTFTISYTGDISEIEVTLSATTATYTFPATALCVSSDGTATGDNTLVLSGVSGDKYIIMINKIGSNYRVIAKNFGQ